MCVLVQLKKKRMFSDMVHGFLGIALAGESKSIGFLCFYRGIFNLSVFDNNVQLILRFVVFIFLCISSMSVYFIYCT